MYTFVELELEVGESVVLVVEVADREVKGLVEPDASLSKVFKEMEASFLKVLGDPTPSLLTLLVEALLCLPSE